MQVIAMALAKEGEPGVVPNENGWEIGVYEVGLSEAGRDWVGRVGLGVEGRAGGKDDRVDVDVGSKRVVDEVMETQTIVSHSVAFFFLLVLRSGGRGV